MQWQMLPLALMKPLIYVNLQFIKATPKPRLLLEGRNIFSLKKATCDRIDSHSITIRLSTMSLIQSSFFRRTNNIAPINQEALSS